MSIIKAKLTQNAEKTINDNPFVQSGIMLNSIDIVGVDANNQFFTAINNMSTLDLSQTLQSETLKSGKSILVKAPGTLEERTFINPKSYESLYGSIWGKIGTTSSFTQGDIVFSGAKNQLPTVIGVTTLGVASPGLNHSQNELKAPITTEVPPVSLDGFNIEPIYPSNFIGPIPKPFTSDKPVKQDSTLTGAMLGNLRSGSYLIPSSTLLNMVNF